jgi:hypothetical protein
MRGIVVMRFLILIILSSCLIWSVAGFGDSSGSGPPITTLANGTGVFNGNTDQILVTIADPNKVKCDQGDTWSCIVAYGSYAQVLTSIPSILSMFNTQSAASGGSSGSGSLTGGSTGQSATLTPAQLAELQASNPQLAAQAAAAQAGLANLAAQGVTPSADGSSLNLGNGTSVPMSAISDPNAIGQALGLSAADQAALDATFKAAADAAKRASVFSVAAVPTAAGGGSGTGGGSESSNGGNDQQNDPKSQLEKAMAAAMKKGRDPAAVARAEKVAGLSRKFGSDQIGVANDDIFIMVTRCYNSKRMHQAFLTPK